MSSLYTIWYRFVNGETNHNEHLKSSVTCRWGGTSQDTISKTNNVLVLKTREKMEDDELPTQSIPFFTAFWFLKGNQTTNIFLWNRKITWFPNECMVKLWDFHPKMVHGLAWYYIDACFNLLFWTGFMDHIFSESPEEILLTPSLSVDPWLIVFVPGAVFLRTRFFCKYPEKVNFLFQRKRHDGCLLFFSHTHGSGGKVAEFIWKGNYCWWKKSCTTWDV